MHALLLCLATAAVGIGAGWQRMPDGGMQYIIQLDPQTLESLGAGQAIQSDIPPNAGEIRSYRIIVGKQPLPRETPPAPPKQDDVKKPQPAAPNTLPSVSAGKPLFEQTTAYVDTDGSTEKGQSPSETAPKSQPDQPAKPWLPLWFTVLGLFASIGINVFLGWAAWDSRRQLYAKSIA